jgi:hypothetical protein
MRSRGMVVRLAGVALVLALAGMAQAQPSFQHSEVQSANTSEHTAQQPPQNAPGSPYPWPVVPTARLAGLQAQAALEQSLKVTPQEQAANDAANAALRSLSNPSVAEGQAEAAALEAAQIKEADARRAATLGNVFSHSRRDPRGQGMFTPLDAMSNDRIRQGPPDYYMQNRDRIERPCGPHGDGCRAYMRENVFDEQSAREAHAQYERFKTFDKVYADAGPVKSFIGRTAAIAVERPALSVAALSLLVGALVLLRKGYRKPTPMARREPTILVPAVGIAMLAEVENDKTPSRLKDRLHTSDRRIAEANLVVGDWVFAALSLCLTPIVPLTLAIYNFVRGRKKLGLLYLGVCGVAVLVVVLGVLLRIR